MTSYSRIRNTLHDKYNQEEWFDTILPYLTGNYVAIEDRMIGSFRYVQCHPLNYDAFSYEYASILRDTGSVFGSVMDRLLDVTKFPKTKSDYDMGDYRRWLIGEIKDIQLVTVRVFHPINFLLIPFEDIRDENRRLGWWAAYNNLKHSDIESFTDGNLGNSLNGLAAVAVLYAAFDPSNGSAIRLFSDIGFIDPPISARFEEECRCEHLSELYSERAEKL